jgi:hypothetical protein
MPVDYQKDESLSLSSILSRCPDFRGEKSAMAEFAEELGIETDATPKGYCELAGRGVEYGWGKSKMHFRLFFPFIFGTLSDLSTYTNSSAL